jgi:hypothetical protein
MAKGKSPSKGSPKKEATKTLKEKRDAKQAKKDNKRD